MLIGRKEELMSQESLVFIPSDDVTLLSVIADSGRCSDEGWKKLHAKLEDPMAKHAAEIMTGREVPGQTYTSEERELASTLSEWARQNQAAVPDDEGGTG